MVSFRRKVLLKPTTGHIPGTVTKPTAGLEYVHSGSDIKATSGLIEQGHFPIVDPQMNTPVNTPSKVEVTPSSSATTPPMDQHVQLNQRWSRQKYRMTTQG